MPAQIFFFAQDLTVEQPCGRDQINQTYPIWEDEEFSNQDNRKGHINGIATESKNAVGYESVGMISVNAHSKALPKGNQAPQEQQQPRQAKQHSDPRDYLGMEKLVRRHSRPVEGRGEQDIEIEQANGGIKKSVLSILPNFIAFMPCLLRTEIRVNTIPSNTTIVSAPRYFGIKILHFFTQTFIVRL
jgi:hypothetical protein